ncbi:hypothetical protein [Priestia megaterium]|nr:hypothetical protein [Priestia megaterium]
MHKQTDDFTHMLQQLGGTKIIIEVEKGSISPFHLVHDLVAKH